MRQQEGARQQALAAAQRAEQEASRCALLEFAEQSPVSCKINACYFSEAENKVLWHLPVVSISPTVFMTPI